MARVRAGMDVSEWFGLRQGYVTSPRLLNVYMDGVLREVNDRVLGKEMKLLSEHVDWFEINQLLFSDDTTLMADAQEKLCELVSGLGRVCEEES